MTFDNLKPIVAAIVLNDATSREEKLLSICQLLTDSIDYYNWVGFYFANHETQTLHLGPYVVVPDVSAQDNYIACSFTVKSEIVVPLFVDGINIGQIDIDSHVLDPFTEADERFLEYVNQEIVKLF
jgi:L-methionine (R)-S-oxide reductase